MRVIATAPGYDNLTVRQPGEEFDMPETVFDKGIAAPSWFKKVGPKRTQDSEVNKDPV